MSRNRSRALIPALWLACSASLFGAQAYYSPVTVNSGQVPSTQTDFPILVSYTDARFKTIGNGGHVANANGYDIRPYSDSSLSTALTYELERYNASTGEVIMWVKRSSLADGNVTYLGYGDTSLTTDGSSSSTWSNSFLAVYHLKDGSTLSVTDSANNKSTTNHSATATSGKIDGAANVASASSQYIEVSSLGSGTSAITVSAWVNASSFPNSYNGICGACIGGSDDSLISVKSNGKLAIYINIGGGSFSSYDGTGSHTLSTSTDYYIVATHSSAAGLTGYVNASSDGTGSGGTNPTSWLQTFMGQDCVTSGRFWNGKLDEVRFANVVRTANWITTEYNNQSAPGTFATLGTEVAITPTVRGWFMFLKK